MYAPAITAFLEQPAARALLAAGTAVTAQPSFTDTPQLLPTTLRALLASELQRRKLRPATPEAPGLALSVALVEWLPNRKYHNALLQRLSSQPCVTLALSGPATSGYTLLTTIYTLQDTAKGWHATPRYDAGPAASARPRAA